MKRTGRALFALTIFVLAILFAACALAAGESWTCEHCGHGGNTGNFCPECGAARPRGDWDCGFCGQRGNEGNFCTNCGARREDASDAQGNPVTPTPRPTATPKPTKTPKPTPTPTPSVSGSLNSTIRYRDGKTIITWTTKGNAGTCSVRMEAVNGSSKQHRWRLGTSSTGSLTTGELMPGKTYKLTLLSEDYDVLDERTYTIPDVPTFQDGKLKNSSVKITIEPRRLPAGSLKADAKKVNSLSASRIKAGLDSGDESYGFKYQMKMPTLAKERTFYVTIYVEAPGGYLEVEVFDDVTFDRVNRGYQTLWWNCLGTDFFKNLYETTGDIPSGNYSITMFWDGMYVNRSTLKVSP